jgi:hypothetical protein
MTSKEFYQEKLKTESDPIKQVGWDNEVKAVKRYKQIAKLIPPKTQSIVDYGCGIGNFSKYVSNKVDYLGMDSFQEYVDAANDMHPELQVIHCDGKGVIPECDIAVLIGVWTLRGKMNDVQYWNNVVIQLKNILKSVKDQVIVNGFHDQVDYKDPKLFYHDMNRWIKLANLMQLKIQIQLFEKYEFIILLKK